MRRFYVGVPLAAGQSLALPEALQHRLSRVLRLGAGSKVALFNGADGLYEAELTNAKARTAHLTRQLQPQSSLPQLGLVLAMPKREAWESALRQATELGATDIWPVKSDFSQVAKFNAEKAQAQLVEAAEQCERLNLPTLHPLQSLTGFLASLNTPCAWAYERGTTGRSNLTARQVLVGPEGGFSPAEVEALQNHPQLQPFTLGQTILRTDTAVVAALTRLSLV